MDQNRCAENEEMPANLSEARPSCSESSEEKQEESEELKSQETDRSLSHASNKNVENGDEIEEILSDCVRKVIK